MFKVTGSIKDANESPKTFSETEMSASEVAALFGLSVAEHVEFDYLPSIVKKDMLNGVDKKPRGVNMSCYFTGTFKGNSVAIRYYTDKLGDTARPGVFKYQPNIVRFSGQTIYFPEDNMDMLVFHLLHTQNSNSPIKKECKKYFTSINRKEEARMKLDIYSRMGAIRDEILEMRVRQPEKLRRKAMGIYVTGARPVVTSYSSIDEVATTLIEFMEKYKDLFVRAWTSPDTDIRGVIQDAFEKGYIITRHSGDVRSMHWGTHGQELICRFPANQDPLNAGVQYALNNYDMIMPRLQELLIGKQSVDRAKELAEKIKKDVAEINEATAQSTIQDIIQMAIDRNVVEYLPSEGVVLLKESGLTLVENVSDDNWRMRFELYLTNNKKKLETIKKLLT